MQPMKTNLFVVMTTVLCMSFLTVACGPTAYTIDVEARQPSKSGLDLTGKTMSVVFLDNGISEDSLFIASMSESFANSLDLEYFGGDSLVGIYALEPLPDVRYSEKEGMLEVLMETGSDVVFLFDVPVFDSPTISSVPTTGSTKAAAEGTFPYSIAMYAYDSMNSSDRVFDFKGYEVAKSSAYLEGGETMEKQTSLLKANLVEEARKSGVSASVKFLPQWQRETYLFYLYESETWYESYYAVNDYDWKKAIDIWMTLLDTKNLQKKACAEYNIAVACYMSAQYKLALEWITLSAKDFKLPTTTQMTARIKKKLQ